LKTTTIWNSNWPSKVPDKPHELDALWEDCPECLGEGCVECDVPTHRNAVDAADYLNDLEKED
jgi:hypothetical protein